MKRFLVLTALMAVCASVAFAQAPYLYENDNEIGIYMVENPTADNAQDMAMYTGALPGMFTCYVVCTHPVNMHYGAPGSTVRNPITLIGGMEFRINLPTGLFIQEAVMPPNSINFATPPEWLAGVEAPVVDDHCTLLRLTLATFSTAPGYIYLSPVQVAPQSIPGSMSITDYLDDFRLNPAYPVSGSYDLPVFGVLESVVPTEDASWSDVKSLYR